MKLSVSFSGEDVAVLDDWSQRRIAVALGRLHRAIRMFRYPALEDDYDDAWSEREATGEAEAWDQTVGDGYGDAAR